LQDLKSGLQSIGSDLLIQVGKPEKELPKLMATCKSSIVLTEQLVTDEELSINKEVKQSLPKDSQFLELWGYSLYHLEDLPFKPDFSDLQDTFTPFKEKCERKCKVRALLPAPKSGQLPLPSGLCGVDFFPQWNDLPYKDDVPQPAKEQRTAFTLAGGEKVALARLKYYLWDSDMIAQYFDIRNGMLGGDYSTKLAAHLAHGCISPRRIYHDIALYEKQRTKNKSTYWVVFELTWRDFYRFFAMKHGNRIFQSFGLTNSRPNWSKSSQALRRWKEGTTGWPLVDANMRELNATGFMSNRGRQNVASFLALDLGLDWRAGADYFESLLVDYDVSSNWGTWVAAAGLTGGRVNKFNIVKQSNDYDRDGKYLRTWIPELEQVRGKKVHEPWTLSRAEREQSCAEEYPDKLATGGHDGGPGKGKGGYGKSVGKGGKGSSGGSGGYDDRKASGKGYGKEDRERTPRTEGKRWGRRS
jgi:deoxyribodipyrimidine photo-lyase